jgi:hypothetical protein
MSRPGSVEQDAEPTGFPRVVIGHREVIVDRCLMRGPRLIGPLRTLLLRSVVAVVLAASASSAVSSASATTVHVWLTTVDGAYKMSDMGTIAFGDAVPSAPTVVVDPSRGFQTMAGFGGAITDSSAVVLYRLSAAAREATMRMLFDPRTGDRLS